MMIFQMTSLIRVSDADNLFIYHSCISEKLVHVPVVEAYKDDIANLVSRVSLQTIAPYGSLEIGVPLVST